MQQFKHINDMYYQMVQDALDGDEVAPRGHRTREIISPQYCLEDCRQNILVNAERRVNWPFMIAEWLWISLGRNDLAFIGAYNRQMEEFAEGGQFRGAYGPQFIEQVGYVVDTLQEDPSSRQAVMSFWRQRPRKSKDVPCTLGMQFLIRARDGHTYLDLIVNMRSNDAWLGAPYDIFTFTMIQQHVAGLLCVTPGRYYHHPASLHIYERHFDVAQAMCDEGPNGWRPSIIPLGQMPREFQAVLVGLSLMSDVGDRSVGGMIGGQADYMPEPWASFLRVLAYRFHQTPALVPHFWWKVMQGDMDAIQPEVERGL